MNTRMHTLTALLIALAIGCLSPSVALAKWNADWKEKTSVVLDTSAVGANIKSSVSQIVVPVRLHTGNFEFTKAKPDGSDLRFVAADDKTELPFQIEYFDATNELAVIWVALPTLLPSMADQKISLYYGNPAAQASSSATITFDVGAIAVVHGPDASGGLLDASTRKSQVSATGNTAEPAGALGSAIKLASGALTISGASTKIEANGATVSFWAKLEANSNGSLVRIASDGATIELKLAAGIPQLETKGSVGVGSAKATQALAAGAWTHLVVTLGDVATVWINGAESVKVPLKLSPMAAQFAFGSQLVATLDELQVYSSVRSNDWIKASFAAQGPEGKMVRVETDEKGGSEASYIKILIDNLPLDALIIIALLGVMLLIAIWVVVNKALLLVRATRANEEFLKRFRDLGSSVFLSEKIPSGMASGGFANSTLYPVFDAARAGMLERIPGGKGKLENRSMPAIKSTVDTAVVAQNTKMNRWMVLLTIAISGGPFIGLLGTVMGVMITFAAIAAVGDVNINAIAPGIAAALLATVAGLAVAIPALFAYNYLASRVKEVTTDTAVFGEEVISKMSETFGQ
jgi:biopolymer transport protein ExbB